MKLFTKVILPAAFVATILAGSAEAAPKFVGVDGCKCHRQEITDWERSKHAKAFELLEAGKKETKKKKAGLDDKDYTKEARCIKCHTTGYRESGGFEDLASTPKMAGIGCEMCHGAGSEYRNLHKEKTTKFTRDEARAAGQRFGSVDPSVCGSCHGHKDNPFKPEVDESYKFDLQEALKDSRAFHKLYPLEGKH